MSRSESCIFCFDDPAIGSSVIAADRVVKAFDRWWVVLQPESVRNKTKMAAGMLIAKRHFEIISLARPDEAAEIPTIIKPAAEALCQAVGSSYTGQESVGFNQGADAGQTVLHAHIHILPVSAEDPAELKVRGGIIGAYDALRQARLQ